MPAPSSIDEFLELARKSGVVDEQRLTSHVQKLRTAGTLPAEPRTLANLLIRDALLTYFQAEHLLKGKWKRFTIGKYKVLEQLGAGGMGSVYLCEHKFMRRRVAVKVLPTAKADDQAALERFYREARAVAALDHPNIVRAYDIDQDEKLHFLVMEYVDGASLQEIIKRSGPMDPLRAAHYISQAAHGLQHALMIATLVHRDIKPGNILVDRGGVVKVLDMGLARFFNDEVDQITRQYDENVLGTADYLAPEQALDSHGVDIRADIYGLGATFYYCLTGRTPFSEGTIAQKLIWHQTRQPKSIKSFREDVPDELLAIIDKMMAKDPNDRYQTPIEVVAALEPWTTTPIPPPPEAEMPQLSPAAMGINPGEGGSTLPQPPLPANVPSSKVRKVWQVPATPNPKPAGGAPAARSPETTPAKKAPTPVPQKKPAVAKPTPPPPATAASVENGLVAGPPRAAAPAPAIAQPPSEESLPWEQLADQAVGSSARVEAIRRSLSKESAVKKISRSVPRLKALLKRIPPRQRLWWLTGAAVLCLALLALVLWLVLGPGLDGRNSAVAPVPQRMPVTLFVSHAGQPNALTSVGQALRQARNGDRIVLLDDLTESLQWDGKDNNKESVKDVTIEAEKGKVVWRLPKSPNDGLVFSGVTGLRLKGLTLDGGAGVKDLIVLTGHCPGLTLDGLVLKGFTQSAIKVINCAGTSNRPVTLTGLKIVTANEKDAGVLFDLNSKVQSPLINQHIVLRDCVFEGPAKNRVQTTASGNTENVECPKELQPVVTGHPTPADAAAAGAAAGAATAGAAKK